MESYGAPISTGATPARHLFLPEAFCCANPSPRDAVEKAFQLVSVRVIYCSISATTCAIHCTFRVADVGPITVHVNFRAHVPHQCPNQYVPYPMGAGLLKFLIVAAIVAALDRTAIPSA